MTSITGFSGAGGNYSRIATSYQVLDSAYCFRIVHEFKGGGGTPWRSAKEMAESLAARLNTDEGNERAPRAYRFAPTCGNCGERAPSGGSRCDGCGSPLYPTEHFLEALYRRARVGDRRA